MPIIVSSCGKKAFSFEDGILKVTLGFAYEPDFVTARKFKEKAREKLATNQSNILAFLKENSHSSLQETANALSLSLAGVKKMMAKLQTLELITRIGSKKGWILACQVDYKSRLIGYFKGPLDNPDLAG